MENNKEVIAAVTNVVEHNLRPLLSEVLQGQKELSIKFENFTQLLYDPDKGIYIRIRDLEKAHKDQVEEEKEKVNKTDCILAHQTVSTRLKAVESGYTIYRNSLRKILIAVGIAILVSIVNAIWIKF
jgi:hypothetical protein